ncbi:endonuclease domain-containing protein [Zeaxanthinibacter enoshimensis]|uniref:endonuclease domain-containing protein n=1 Tax=Zeaxanthinibacter enoshimensis TaxID=392009 RepID=UPI0026D53DF5|nr:DUF559 domain-containing protein [Zeaxanthinibacter enoshimensis]
MRRKLRKNLTRAEAFLWKRIKSRQLAGRRFTKQHSIGPYIVDFYCASERLVIELDGQWHNDSLIQDYDYNRTKFLEGKGFRVVRFENVVVFERIDQVLEEIREHFDQHE